MVSVNLVFRILNGLFQCSCYQLESLTSSYKLYLSPKPVWVCFLPQSLAVYFQDSSGLVRTGPGLVRLKVALVRTCPELDKFLPVLVKTCKDLREYFCQYGLPLSNFCYEILPQLSVVTTMNNLIPQSTSKNKRANNKLGTKMN